jgi:multiple sugar transport system ATP-binding protein
MAHIRLDRVTKKFGSHVAVRDLTLDVEDGEFFVLLGPTGAGKTTTLRLIAGLEKPDSGTISIAGEDVRDWSVAERDVALVFQYYSLYPRYTVRQNLEFPLKSRVRHYNQTEINTRIARAARTLRIEHLLERKTDKLSGGEMQRVSIGRAIVREPRVFLMDEPLSNLDAKLREALRAELKDLQMKLGATFLFVTHDQIEAMSMGDKVGVLNAGRIVQVGTPNEIYNRPRDVFVAGFVGSPAMNLVKGELRNGQVSAAAGKISFPLDRSARELSNGDGPVTLGVRSEDVRVGTGETIEARVHDVENHGVEKIITLRVEDQLLRATVPATVDIDIEGAVRFGLNTERVHCFDGRTGVNLGYRGSFA